MTDASTPITNDNISAQIGLVPSGVPSVQLGGRNPFVAPRTGARAFSGPGFVSATSNNPLGLILPGSAQVVDHVLQCIATNTNGAIPTTDGKLPNSTNVVNILIGSAYGLSISLMAVDVNNVQNAFFASNYSALMYYYYGSAQPLLYQLTDGATKTVGTGNSAIFSFSADPTNNGLSINFIPPASDAWNVVAFVRSLEVRT